VDPQDATTDRALDARHSTRGKLAQLLFDLNIIEVRLERAELLLPALSKRGVDSRQIYEFTRST
jgi:hypothetical protein